MTAPLVQMLVLVGADGARATVPRCIATEASHVLRDLLDGYDVMSSHDDYGRADYHDMREVPTPPLGPASSYPSSTTRPTHQPVEDLFILSNTPTTSKPSQMDLLDMLLTPASPASPTTHNASGPPLAAPTPTPPPPPPPHQHDHLAPIELPFPYLDGDELSVVCQHMECRYRISSFATDDGHYRVIPVKVRPIPKPMVLPLVEYLDADDRRLVSKWDEKWTVKMVKAATLLNYEELMQLASAKLASYLLEKDLEGIRALLNVDADFSEAELAELAKEADGAKSSATGPAGR